MSSLIIILFNGNWFQTIPLTLKAVSDKWLTHHRIFCNHCCLAHYIVKCDKIPPKCDMARSVHFDFFEVCGNEFLIKSSVIQNWFSISHIWWVFNQAQGNNSFCQEWFAKGIVTVIILTDGVIHCKIITWVFCMWYNFLFVFLKNCQDYVYESWQYQILGIKIYMWQ